MDPRFEPVMSSSQSPASIVSPPTVDTVAVDAGRVMRNTYWLLALSLLPTIAGAFVGMQLNFMALLQASPTITLLGMFAVMMGSMFVVTRLRNSAWAVPAMFGFTFVMGLMLTPILTVAGGLKNGGQLIALSAGLTAAVFFSLAAYATVSKRDFSFMGKFLFVGLILLVIAMLANIFLQIPALALTLSAVAVLIFSLFLLFDLSRIVRGGETNYVMATLSLYISIYNIFVNLLSLLMAFGGERD